MMKLKPCPFCGKEVVRIKVFDDEGNYHGELGCEYEKDPWSGLSYGLYHPRKGNCLMANDIIGNLLFDTPEDAAKAWNKRADRKESKKIHTVIE